MIVAFVHIMEDERLPQFGVRDIQPGNPLFDKIRQCKVRQEIQIKIESLEFFQNNFINLPEVDLPATVEKFLTIWS
jgi:hypothetical protein